MVKCENCRKKFSGMIKMAKSNKKDFITLETLKEKGISPLAYRYFVLGTHYRKKLAFSWEALEAAQNTLDNLYAIAGELGEPNIGCAEFEEWFEEAISDDLNTPQALAVLWDLLKSDYPPEAKKESLLQFDKILGLDLHLAKPINVPNEIKKLAKKRDDLRSQKKYEEADKVRDEISKAGFRLDDTPAGSVIKILK
ncbi:hypothetical protein IID19_04020 [Patescibacteria group bacterium]|nr:hypothetical protein [Patescibacteria group bacterium]